MLAVFHTASYVFRIIICIILFSTNSVEFITFDKHIVHDSVVPTHGLEFVPIFQLRQVRDREVE